MANNEQHGGAQNAIQIIVNDQEAPEPTILQMAKQRASESITCINHLVHEYEIVK